MKRSVLAAGLIASLVVAPVYAQQTGPAGPPARQVQTAPAKDTLPGPRAAEEAAFGGLGVAGVVVIAVVVAAVIAAATKDEQVTTTTTTTTTTR